MNQPFGKLPNVLLTTIRNKLNTSDLHDISIWSTDNIRLVVDTIYDSYDNDVTTRIYTYRLKMQLLTLYINDTTMRAQISVICTARKKPSILPQIQSDIKNVSRLADYENIDLLVARINSGIISDLICTDMNICIVSSITRKCNPRINIRGQLVGNIPTLAKLDNYIIARRIGIDIIDKLILTWESIRAIDRIKLAKVSLAYITKNDISYLQIATMLLM